MKSNNAVDWDLRFYSKLTESLFLNYGYWSPEDPLTMEGARRAQERYACKLIERIPCDVKTVLDVGAGVGGNALKLRDAGFAVEALSPDAYLQESFLQNTNGQIHYHLTSFEEFSSDKTLYLSIMSESCQYIDPHNGLAQSARYLRRDGYLLVSDFFCA